MSCARSAFGLSRNVWVVLRTLSIAWMLAVVVLSSPRNASASCGDYLIRQGQPVSSHWLNRVEAVSYRDQVFHQPGSANAPEQAPIPRCSGPGCSSSPIPFSPSTSAPLRQTQTTEPAALLEAILLSKDAQETRELPESERGALYLPSTFFRPPAF